MDEVERILMGLKIVSKDYLLNIPVTEYDIHLPNMGFFHFIKSRTSDGIYLSYVKKKDFSSEHIPKSYYCRAKVELTAWDRVMCRSIDQKVDKVARKLRSWLSKQDSVLGVLTSTQREVKDL